MSDKQLIGLLVVLYLLYLLRPKSYSLPPLPPPSVDPNPNGKKRGLSQKDQAKLKKQKEINPWTNIHYSFASPNLINSWQIRGHNYLTAGQWIAAGALPTEYELVEWISNTKAQAINAYQLNNYSFNEPAWAISYFGSLEPLRREYYQSKRI